MTRVREDGDGAYHAMCHFTIARHLAAAPRTPMSATYCGVLSAVWFRSMFSGVTPKHPCAPSGPQPRLEPDRPSADRGPGQAGIYTTAR